MCKRLEKDMGDGNGLWNAQWRVTGGDYEQSRLNGVKSGGDQDRITYITVDVVVPQRTGLYFLRERGDCALGRGGGGPCGLSMGMGWLEWQSGGRRSGLYIGVEDGRWEGCQLER
jgi:hypothetical protein